MLNSTARFLNVARAVAVTSRARMKHGAVVVKHGHILGVSPNLVKNDPRVVNYKECHVHAELAALRRANFPRKATIYVARVSNQGADRMSRPCINCQEVLDGLQYKVYWTITESNDLSAEDSFGFSVPGPAF